MKPANPLACKSGWALRARALSSEGRNPVDYAWCTDYMLPVLSPPPLARRHLLLRHMTMVLGITSTS